jgi:hypothetical protein
MFKIGVIVPTKNNPIAAAQAICSLYFRAKNTKNLIFVIVIDFDDSASSIYFENFNLFEITIIKGVNKGYYGSHAYYNRAAQFLVNKEVTWFLSWSDDIVNLTQNWDQLLYKERHRSLCLSLCDMSAFGEPFSKYNLLVFALHSRAYRVMEQVSGHHAIDTFNDLIYHPLGLITRLSNFKIYHWGMDEPFFSTRRASRKESEIPVIDKKEIEELKEKIRVNFSLFERFCFILRNLNYNCQRKFNSIIIRCRLK